MRQLLIFLIFTIGFASFGQVELQLNANPKGGLYDHPQVVTLTAVDSAVIYYTLDGSIPTPTSLKYTKPIEIKIVGVIRAIAYKKGLKSAVLTQSYFCDRKYTLPVISITTNPSNLWDYSSGIYVKGCCAQPVEPYLGANFWRSSERAANIEMYEPDGELCFNQGAGIGVFGGYSRGLPQKSLFVVARSKYGAKNFKYPIFPERDFDKYKSFVLRNSGGDFKRTHFRDAFMTQMAAPTGVAIQAYRPAIVFLNGEYWGIHNIRERINEHYLASNYGVDKDNVDILRHNGDARHGTSAHYKKMLNFMRTNDLSKDAAMQKLGAMMDIEDYIRYNIAEVYSDNRDAGGNIRFWRERTDSAKWRWVLYDLDLGLGNNSYTGYKNNTLRKFTNANTELWPDPAWSTFIIRTLLSNEKVKMQYINTFADHLNTVYKEETALALIDKIQEPLKEEMKFHVKRWQTTYDNWQFHVGVLKTFVKERPTYLRKFIMEKFGLKGTVNVTINVQNEDAAKIKFNSLKIKENFKGIYFKNVPIVITVNPRHDYEFIGWKGRTEKTMSLTIVPTADLVLEPLFQPKKRSELTDKIIFSEICMFQIDTDTSKDWVELYNNSDEEMDLSGWVFTKGSYKDGFKIPEGTVLESKQYVVLSEDLASFKTGYPTELNALGNMDFGLSKKKEHIKLYDKEGFIVDSLSYKYKDWEEKMGVSIVHPDSARFRPENWSLEAPNPGTGGKDFLTYLKLEADKQHWMKIYFIGGGGFFFILVVGLLSRRSYKKRNIKQKQALENQGKRS